LGVLLFFAIPPVSPSSPLIYEASKDSPSCNPTMFTTRIISLALLFAYPYLVWLMGKNGLARLGGFVCTRLQRQRTRIVRGLIYVLISCVAAISCVIPNASVFESIGHEHCDSSDWVQQPRSFSM
jgi:hypothetical protein